MQNLFESEKELDLHIEISERCDPIIAPQVDGITRKMKSLLQSKKPAFKGQRQSDKWKQIYQTLFPEDEAVPDPCKFPNYAPTSLAGALASSTSWLVLFSFLILSASRFRAHDRK